MGKKHSSGFLAIVNDARKHIQETDIHSVNEMLNKKTPFYLVDVREESEWAVNHLPSAIHLSKGVIERDIENTIPDKNAKIVLYCGGGFRSALSAENLQKMGYTDVISMDGGYRSWIEAGYPLAE